MIFIEPKVVEVYNTISNNNDLINKLKKYGYLKTKESYYEQYDPSYVEKINLEIQLHNSDVLLRVSEILLENSETIKSTEISLLVINKVAFQELADAFGEEYEKFSIDAYKQLMYTYKYCYVSSFFQNNKNTFMPDNDFVMLSKDPAGSAFYDAMMKEFDKLDIIIGKCCEYMDFDKIPWQLINYLSQLLGFEKATINASDKDELKYRELVKNIIDIYRIKGTNYSFELFFNFMGFNISINEYYFDRRFYYNTKNGNVETQNSNNEEYEYYLTTQNPVNNTLKDIGINEIVKPSDITSQYSLLEFEELVKKYGIEAVLGYSVLDKNGEEYKNKVYKYFKTNLIYYHLSMDNQNPSEEQLAAITKYLSLLTPSFVMKDIKVNLYETKESEGIGFDGDGSKKPDVYGNYNGFEMLDGEDWDKAFENDFVAYDSDGNKIKIHDNGETEVFKNSIGGNDFRLPLDSKIVNASLNKYLTGGTGTNYLNSKRLKYYIVYEHSYLSVFSYNSPGVLITPYFTVPPHVGTEHFLELTNKWYKNTPIVNLTGGDGNGGEDCVKNQIKMAGFYKEVDFVTEESLNDFIESSPSFSELKYEKVMPRTLTIVQSINYGPSEKIPTLVLASKEFNGYDISNISNINNIYNEVPQYETIYSYYKNKKISETLEYGKYYVAYSGSKLHGTLYLFRFGGYKHPVKSLSNYETVYQEYVNSFNYKLEKVYDGSRQEIVSLNSNYTTFSSYAEAEEHMNKRFEKMKNDYGDLDYVERILYYVSSENSYYSPVKVAAETNAVRYNYGTRNHIFSSIWEATEYFNEHQEEKFVNAEFFINGDVRENGLYVWNYTKRKAGCLIYSIADEKLYIMTGATLNSIKPYDNFFGNLKIEYKNRSAYPTAVIYDYDKAWEGYDEEADSEDFILYNSEHIIDWEELGFKNAKISRPIKYSTDLTFDKNGSLGSKIIAEIAKNTIDNFSYFEKLNWKYGENNFRTGLLSSIEECFEHLVLSTKGYQFPDEFTHGTKTTSDIDEKNRSLDYYSSFETFFNDYYKIIVQGDLRKENLPETLVRDANIQDTISNEEAEKIKKYYNLAMLSIKDTIDNISKNRIYYSFIQNWRTANKSHEERLNEDFLKNPLTSSVDNNTSFREKTTFIGLINTAVKKLKEEHKENIIFDLDSELLGDDSYSLNGNFQKITEVYNSGKISTPDINFYLTRDSKYNYFIAYRLNYGLNNYSKDYYDKHADIYSEFSNLYDYLKNYATNYVNGVINKKDLEDYLKQYYYNKLVKLYRESEIKDVLPLQMETVGKRPSFLYPKLTDTLDGRAGTLKFPSTLLSSYENNGSSISSLKLKFEKINVNYDEEKNVSVSFFIDRVLLIRSIGFDFNRYFKKETLDKLNSQAAREELKKTIEQEYKKIFTCIRPVFFTAFDYTRKNELTSWQKYSHFLLKDFEKIDIEVLDINKKPITDEYGNPIDKNGNKIDLLSGDEYINRLKDGALIRLTVVDNTNFKNIPQEELEEFNMPGEIENVYGYLNIKSLREEFIDNYISVPKSLDWIEKDEYNNATEYISFGDDRLINSNVTNSYFLKTEVIATEDTHLDLLKKYYYDEECTQLVNTKELDKGIDPSKNNFYEKIEIIDEEKYNKYVSGKKEKAVYTDDLQKFSKNKLPIIIKNGKEVEFSEHQKGMLLIDEGVVGAEFKLDNVEKIKNIDENIINVHPATELDSSNNPVDFNDNIILKDYGCEIYTDKDGNVVLKCKNIHAANVKSVTLLYTIIYRKVKLLSLLATSLFNRSTVFVSKLINSGSNTKINKVTKMLVKKLRFVARQSFRFISKFKTSKVFKGLNTFEKHININFDLDRAFNRIARTIKLSNNTFKNVVNKAILNINRSIKGKAVIIIPTIRDSFVRLAKSIKITNFNLRSRIKKSNISIGREIKRAAYRFTAKVSKSLKYVLKTIKPLGIKQKIYSFVNPAVSLVRNIKNALFKQNIDFSFDDLFALKGTYAKNLKNLVSSFASKISIASMIAFESFFQRILSFGYSDVTVSIQTPFESWRLISTCVKPVIAITTNSISFKHFRLVGLISNNFITIIKSLSLKDFTIENSISKAKVIFNKISAVFAKEGNILFEEVFSNYLKVFKTFKISFGGVSVKKETRVEKSCLAVLFNRFSLFSRFEDGLVEGVVNQVIPYIRGFQASFENGFIEGIAKQASFAVVALQTSFENGFIEGIAKQASSAVTDLQVSFKNGFESIVRSLGENTVGLQTSFGKPLVEIM